MITSDQLKDVLDRADKLKHYLKIDEKKIEYEEEDLRTQAPDFWEDQKRAEEQMKKVKSIKKWLDGFQDVRTAADELQLAFDFYKEEMVTEAEVDENYQRAIKAIEDPEEKKKFIAEKEAEYKDLFASPYQAANRGYIDDVIEPRYTRSRIIRAFEMLQTKRLTNPLKKHSNLPL